MKCNKCGREIFDIKNLMSGICGWCGAELPEEDDPLFEYNENQLN